MSPTRRHPDSGHLVRPAFTLVELVLVLVILAILATVALEMVEPQVDQTRFETTQRTLDNVDRAILDEAQTSDGRQMLSGFLVDMGRLPKTRLEAPGSNVLTASELWFQDTLPNYQLVQATTGNVTSTDSANSKDADDDEIFGDDDVRIAFGWRGPYLRFSVGQSQLVDGFGHQIVSSDNASLPSHLRGVANVDISAQGTDVYGVASYGKSRAVGVTTEPYERDLYSADTTEFTDDHYSNCRIRGTVRVQASVGGLPSTLATLDEVSVQLFVPNGDLQPSGEQVFVQRAFQASASANTMDDEVVDVTDPSHAYQSFEFRFFDMTPEDVEVYPGPRVIRAYYKLNASGSQAKSVAKEVVLAPGLNTVDLVLEI